MDDHSVFLPDMKQIETDSVKRDLREVKKMALTKEESIFLFNTVSKSIVSMRNGDDLMKEYGMIYAQIQEIVRLQDKAKTIEQALRKRLSDVIEGMDDARIEEIRKTKPFPKSLKQEVETKREAKSATDKAADQREKAIQSVMQALNYSRDKAEKFVDKQSGKL